MSKPILCVDFDGVLHAYSKGWHDGTIYDGPVPGAMAFLREAAEVFQVEVYSTRSTSGLATMPMRAWLKKHLIAELGDVLGRGVFQMVGFPHEKPRAFVTLDDRAVTFTGTFPSVETLRAFKPWTQRRDGPA